MGQQLISKKSVRANKNMKKNQREYLKEHRAIKAKAPKAKLGKVVQNSKDNFIDCSSLKSFEVKPGFTPKSLKKEQIIEGIAKMDLRGMSGSDFPFSKKLETLLAFTGKKYLIVNAVACDPGLVHDAWLLKHHKNEIEAGMKLLDQCASFEKMIIASPENVPNRYPMGAEKILVSKMLNHSLKPGNLPVDEGILVTNVQTVFMIYKAFAEKSKPEARLITVADLDSGEAKVVYAEYGMKPKDILSLAGVKPESNQKIYMGMGIMNMDPVTEQSVLTNEAGMIAVASRVAEYDDQARCKGCGQCSRKCPAGVDVKKIMKAAAENDFSHVKEYGIEKCGGCATCSYYCAAGKNTLRILMSIRERLQ